MMNDDEKGFLKFYMEQTWEEMRHIEGMRERVAIFIVTIASAIAGFIVQQKYAADTQPLAFFVMAIGLFGLAFTAKLYQIHKRDQNRLDAWYAYYSTTFGASAQVLAVRDQADKASDQEFPWLRRTRHRAYWYAMNVLIVAAGFYLAWATHRVVLPAATAHSKPAAQPTHQPTVAPDQGVTR